MLTHTFARRGLAVVLQVRAGLALVVFRTVTVIVVHEAMALGLILAGVGVAGLTLHLQRQREHIGEV